MLKYHEGKKQKQLLQLREEEKQLRKIASRIARDINNFWGSVEKLVLHKHQVLIHVLVIFAFVAIMWELY